MSHPSRDELNAEALAAGVENPEALPNKQAVVDAIAAAAAAVERGFRLRQPADGDEPVHRVSFGASPRVSIAAGDTYRTADPKLAARLAADPLLEEVSL